MAEASNITDAQAQKYLDFCEKAAREACAALCGRYNLNPEKLSLRFDYTLGMDAWTFNGRAEGNSELIFGIRPTSKHFANTLHHALLTISVQYPRISTLTAVQTNERQNANANAAYDATFSRKKLLASGEYETHTFTSVMLIHKKSRESVMVSGEGISAFSLTNEAHVMLSKKVLGE